MRANAESGRPRRWPAAAVRPRSGCRRPGSLSTPTSPPISSASSRQIDRPRPVPPKRRVVESSACVNGVNRRACIAGSMPGPLSLTSKRSRVAAQRLARSMRTRALLGELERVAEEVGQDLAQPRRVAAHAPRNTLAHHRARSVRRARLGQRGVAMLDRFEQRVQVEVDRLQLQLAGLDLGQVEDVADHARQGLRAVVDLRAGSCSRRAASRPGCRARRARPTRPFSGVRISWLVLARKALLARLAASAVVARAGQRLPDARGARSRLRRSRSSPPLLGVRRVDRARQQAAQEGAAVAAFHRAFDLDRLAASQRADRSRGRASS